MIKIISCFIILAASTVGGFVYAEKFKNRVKELNEIERAIYQLQGEIEYTHTPLPEALQNVAKKSKAPIDMLFDKASKLLYSNEVESVFDAFNKVFKESTATLNINLEDRNVVLDLAKSLGESDIEGHKKIFLLVRDNLKKRIAIAENVMNKNVKMYRYLGFSIGAMIVIVLV